MAFWHEERFGMRKCAVSQKYFYKLTQNMATRERITRAPLAFHLHFYIYNRKKIKENNYYYRVLQRQDFYSFCSVFFFSFIRSLKAKREILHLCHLRDLLIAVALINCHRNLLCRHFHIRIIMRGTRRR